PGRGSRERRPVWSGSASPLARDGVVRALALLAGVAREPERQAKGTGLRLDMGARLEAVGVGQELARALVVAPVPGLVDAGEQVVRALERVRDGLLERLAGVAELERPQRPLAGAHRELERRQVAGLAERRLGARLHVECDAQELARLRHVAVGEP